MIISKLDWDSIFFGYPVGKCIVEDKEKIDLSAFEESPYNLIYVYSKKKISVPGLNLYDEKIYLELKICKNTQIFSPPIVSIFNRDIDSFQELQELALQSGTYSRFNKDLNFKNREYENLYKEWIKQCVIDYPKTKVLIIKVLNQIIAFLTLEDKLNDEFNIGLLAVDKSHRGQGYALNLLEMAASLVINMGSKKISVVTQLDNEPAISLYLKNKFKITEKEYIYHYWKR